jgi:ribonuclease P protein component
MFEIRIILPLMATRDSKLGRDRRIRTKFEYDAVFENGKRIAGEYLFAVIACTTGGSALGTVVSKKWGCAVRRNRIKRLMKESFRLIRADFPNPVRVVLLPRRMPAEVGLAMIMHDLSAIVGQYFEAPSE